MMIPVFPIPRPACEDNVAVQINVIELVTRAKWKPVSGYCQSASLEMRVAFS